MNTYNRLLVHCSLFMPIVTSKQRGITARRENTPCRVHTSLRQTPRPRPAPADAAAGSATRIRSPRRAAQLLFERSTSACIGSSLTSPTNAGLISPLAASVTPRGGARGRGGGRFSFSGEDDGVVDDDGDDGGAGVAAAAAPWTCPCCPPAMVAHLTMV